MNQRTDGPGGLRRAWVATVVALGMTAARAQEPWLTIEGDQVGQHLGTGVAGVGDVNGDGVPDLVGQAQDVSGYGLLRAYSGTTGAVLWSVSGTSGRPFNREQVESLGDFDGDGIGDLLIGMDWAYDKTGRLVGATFVLSGATGATLQELTGTAGVLERFGYRVAAMGDLDADGVPDFAVTSLLDLTARKPHSVTVISGASGTTLFRKTGTRSSSILFGSALSRAGDLDNDGIEDLLVGDPADDTNALDGGRVSAYSGADGSRLFRFGPSRPGAWFGESVSPLGDLDGDGHDDFLVGSRGSGNPSTDTDRLELYSGRTQQVLYAQFSAQEPSDLGKALMRVGDVTGDGFADFVAGFVIRGGIRGYELRSGRTGEMLWWWYHQSLFRLAATPVGDLDGDGIDEWATGQEDYSRLPLQSRVGQLRVHRGNDLYLYADDRSLSSGSVMNLHVRNGSPGAMSGIVIVNAAGAPVFMPWRFGALDSSGAWDVAPVTVPPGLAGLWFEFVAYAISPGGLIDSSPERVDLF